MHSSIHATFASSMYGRANHFSYESYPQQANVFQKWSDDMATMEEKFSMLSTENFEKNDMENNTNNLDETTKGFLKGVATTCRSMGHTEEAAKFAR